MNILMQHTSNVLKVSLVFFLMMMPWSIVKGQNFQQMLKLVADGSRNAGDWFGYSVAISGDYAVIGAFLHDYDLSGGDAKSQAGSVYFFRRSNGVWTLMHKAVASDRKIDGRFGCSVAIDGDYAVIGANRDSTDVNNNNQLANSGSAYVFVRNGNIWTQQQKLVASDRAIDDLFGHSVGISGSYIVVSALTEDQDTGGNNTLSSAGSAYVFVRSGSTWSQQQKIVASDRGAGDCFGKSVGISGDYIVVGAYLEDENAAGSATLSNSGSAYVFVRSGSTWSQQQKIVASDRAIDDLFGNSVAIDGSYVVVGAVSEDDDAAGSNALTDAGSVYVYVRSGSTWSQQQKLVATDRGAQDSLGMAVAISGNYIIAGAYKEDENTKGSGTITDAGSAYIFIRSGSTWSQQQKIVGADRATSDLSGQAVAISGDYALVGSPWNNLDAMAANSSGHAGAAYIYERTSTYVWTGVTSTAWTTASNWSTDTVPSSSKSVIIPVVTPFSPRINTSGVTVANFTLQNAQTLAVISVGNLNVTGNIENNGLIAGGAKTILNGSSSQTISGVGSFVNFELNNNAGAVIAASGSKVTVRNLLTVTSGTLSTNGNLVLRSIDVNNTAKVGPVLGSISGNVVHERMLSAPSNGSGGRSWRLLTSPLKGSSNNSVYYNWQNNGINDGTGIEIWGPGGGNGLSSGPAASLRTYNASTNTYVGVTNTQTQSLFDATGNKAFLVFVSGPYGSGNVASGAAYTNSDATGELITGTQNYSFTPPNATNIYCLIGNPYACPIDFDKVYLNTNTANINRKFWVIDPSLGNIGAYATVTYTGGIYVTSAGSQDQYIQNGQAFFVEGNNIGNQSTVEIQEDDKETTASQTLMFRTNGGNLETFRTKLYKTVNSTSTLLDGCVVAAHQNSNNAVDNEDGGKFGNFNENISIVKGSTYLAIDARQLLDNNDTIHLSVSNMQQTTYQLEFEPGNMSAPGLTAALIDNYTNTTTIISLDSNTSYTFIVNGNSASSGNNRFKVVFNNNTPLNLQFLSLGAQKEGNQVKINWTVSDENGITEYELERSGDGRQFEKIAVAQAQQSGYYNSIDATPLSGKNYYRIKALSRGVNGVYSNVVAVNLNTNVPSVELYPNPVKDEHLQVRINDLKVGNYQMQLYNVAGQQLLSKQIAHNGGSSTMELNVTGFASGLYMINIIDEQGLLIAEQRLMKH